ncbi:MAG: ribosome small subunit-dependent GTPase A [Bacilli bacterium]|jgi:ribosome biogenesis GTPase|nr:ribosome small subunit-dependent GTPase A [Bacilli bacterium]
MKQGIVVSAYGGKFVAITDKQYFNLSPRGLIRYKSGEILPGDIVAFDEVTLTIEKILPRENKLPRPRVANVSQIMIMASAVEPEFSPLLIYKTLAYSLMYGIKPFVVISKIDRLSNLEEMNQFKKQLSQIGFDVILYSKKTMVGLAELKDKLHRQVTLAIGQTGVGKSSLINLLDDGFKRAIGEYSKALGRGKHKTKEVIFLAYSDGFIVDSPGFSSLELDLYKEDLSVFFPGFSQAVGKCFFRDCMHINEKRCEVRKLIENKTISAEAYLIYQKLLDELQYRNKRFSK